MGGEGDGTNLEELFAVGWAACFESALGAVARREKLADPLTRENPLDPDLMYPFCTHVPALGHAGSRPP